MALLPNRKSIYRPIGKTNW